MWKVDSVRSVCVPGAPFGYGFSITTERGKQLVGFAYNTLEKAQVAETQVRAAVRNASAVYLHSQ